MRPINFETLVATDALDQFEQMQKFNYAEIKIAMPNTIAPEVDDSQVTIKEGVGLARRSNAAYLEMRLSMGHNKRSLNPASILEWIKGHLKEEGENVKHAEIRGQINEGEEPRVIDLVRSRIREKVRLEPPLGTRPSFPDFYDALNKAYLNRKGEISRQFPS